MNLLTVKVVLENTISHVLPHNGIIQMGQKSLDKTQWNNFFNWLNIIDIINDSRSNKSTD